MAATWQSHEGSKRVIVGIRHAELTRDLHSSSTFLKVEFPPDAPLFRAANSRNIAPVTSPGVRPSATTCEIWPAPPPVGCVRGELEVEMRSGTITIQCRASVCDRRPGIHNDGACALSQANSRTLRHIGSALTTMEAAPAKDTRFRACDAVSSSALCPLHALLHDSSTEVPVQSEYSPNTVSVQLQYSLSAASVQLQYTSSIVPVPVQSWQI